MAASRAARSGPARVTSARSGWRARRRSSQACSCAWPLACTSAICSSSAAAGAWPASSARRSSWVRCSQARKPTRSEAA
ncbi:hypothetical protein L560_2283 [Bordetella pertussis STO1-CHOC-0018]|nr:hypothetical protein L560_2283 [Bordetella pertussis STO1-CHOC-0018]